MIALGREPEKEELSEEEILKRLKERSEERIDDDIWDSIFRDEINNFKRDITKGNSNKLYGNLYWLHHCCDHGRIEFLKYLVEDMKVYINIKSVSESFNALHFAARKGHFDVVKYLLENGIDKTVKNTDGLKAEDITEDKKVQEFIKNFDFDEYENNKEKEIEIIEKKDEKKE